MVNFESEGYKAKMSVRVIDSSSSQLHSEFVDWLKDNVKKR